MSMIAGSSGADLLRGSPRPDRIAAGAGDDRVVVQGGGRDAVVCGRGHDVVTADRLDRVARDCELVSREISRDRTANPIGQHGTQVEPDSFARGSTVVAAFQAGRIVDGGAVANGFATSVDAGRTWRDGILPSLTAASRPPGPYERASDPVVAYDALHGVWLVASLAFTPGARGAVVVSRSRDGVRWGPPVTVAASDERLLFDKEWIVCDNGPASPYRGSCYVTYSDLRTRRLSTQASRDGGLTWSGPVGSPDDAGRRGLLGSYAPAPQPVVLPNGVLVIPFFDETRMAAVRSIDGGATFSTASAVAAARFRRTALRAGPLASAEVDGGGTIYLAWSDCARRPSCARNDLLVSRSADGVAWSAPSRIAGTRGRHLVVPGLAADPAAHGRLALAYYAVTTRGRVDVELVTSTDGARSWSNPLRLNAESMPLSWLPRTSGGRMLGDYISTSFAAGRAVPVFALATRPARGYRQATFAASLSVGHPPR